MKLEDYDAIVEEGFAPWLESYYKERLPGTLEEFAAFAADHPRCSRRCAGREGVVPFTPAVATIPYEYFCGGRSMKEFLLDLFRHGDQVQAAMDAALPVLIENMRQVIRGLGLMGLWIGGWRSASEFVSPRLWNRFVFPYFKAMVEAAVEEGAIPVLHFDANWTRDLERLKEFPKGKCVLSLDGKTDIFKAKEILGDHMCIMGDVPSGHVRPRHSRRGDRLLQAPGQRDRARPASSCLRAATFPSTPSTRTSRRWSRRCL